MNSTRTQYIDTSFSNTQVEELYNQMFGFPNITYQESLEMPSELREEIVSRNRVLQTDTYNRTMNHLKGDLWDLNEIYTMQERRADLGYLIFYGIKREIERIARIRITQSEVEFAKEFYEWKRDNGIGVPFFNEEMWQYVLDNNGILPLTIHTLAPGTAILPGDPVFRVEGPGELAAHFEANFHRVFYQSLVATTAREIAEKIGADRFIEVGKRGSVNEEQHISALVAMYVGGRIKRTSNDSGVAAHPDLFIDVGTLAHRYMSFYDSEDEAIENAIQSLDNVSILIDLVNSIEGINKTLRLKSRYRDIGKSVFIRLDSGDILGQAIYTLNQFKKLGFTDPKMDKIVIEDISTVDDMVRIDNAIREAGFDPEKFVVYGAGGLLVTKMKERSNASTGYKLTQVDGVPKQKFSDEKDNGKESAGKSNFPGRPTIVRFPNGQRMIAQVGEFSPNEAEDLFIKAYENGEIFLQDHISQDADLAEASYHEIKPMIGKRTPISPKTQLIIAQVRENYGLEI